MAYNNTATFLGNAMRNSGMFKQNNFGGGNVLPPHLQPVRPQPMRQPTTQVPTQQQTAQPRPYMAHAAGSTTPAPGRMPANPFTANLMSAASVGAGDVSTPGYAPPATAITPSPGGTYEPVHSGIQDPLLQPGFEQPPLSEAGQNELSEMEQLIQALSQLFDGGGGVPLENLGGFIEMIMANPTPFSSEIFQRNLALGNQALEEGRAKAHDRLVADASRRGVFYGTPLTTGIQDLDIETAKAREDMITRLQLGEMERFSTDRNTAIQNALRFGELASSNEQARANTAQMLGMLALQAMFDPNQTLAGLPFSFGEDGGLDIASMLASLMSESGMNEGDFMAQIQRFIDSLTGGGRGNTPAPQPNPEDVREGNPTDTGATA